MLQTIKIDDRIIGDKHSCFVIGEVGQTHDGSLGLAHKFIDAIANAGADGVKFQTHIADAESTPDEPWRVSFSSQDASRYDYWKRMEFNEKQWIGLAQHANEKGLIFLSTPFSIEAVDLLSAVGMPAWKIASGEVNNLPLLNRIARTQKPVLLSSGMSSFSELDSTIQFIREKQIPFGVFQCTTSYPCPPEKVGFNIMARLRDRYKCPVGLSDHSGTIYPGIAGAAHGMNMIEIHVTLSREMFGPDILASITTAELKQMIEGIRFVEKMMQSPLDKDQMAQQLFSMRKIFNKSVVAKKDLSSGVVLQEDLLAYKKPGTGIPASRYRELIGKKLKKNLKRNQQVSESDLDL